MGETKGKKKIKGRNIGEVTFQRRNVNKHGQGAGQKGSRGKEESKTPGPLSFRNKVKSGKRKGNGSSRQAIWEFLRKSYIK